MSKHTIDYAFKSKVLREHEDLLIKQRQSSLLDYSINQYRENGVITPFLRRVSDETKTSVELFNDCVLSGLAREFRECVKINHASRQRTKRLQERVASMLLGGSCLFITLTFNDETLNELSEKQRRVAVTRYLKSFNCQYVANIDFGKTNHREHYHALISCDKISFDEWRKYGNINAERVRNKDISSDKTKLAKYICKLSNHAIKETTKRNSLIYSR